MLKKSFFEVLRYPKLKALPSNPMYLALGSKYEWNRITESSKNFQKKIDFLEKTTRIDSLDTQVCPLKKC